MEPPAKKPDSPEDEEKAWADARRKQTVIRNIFWVAIVVTAYLLLNHFGLWPGLT